MFWVILGATGSVKSKMIPYFKAFSWASACSSVARPLPFLDRYFTDVLKALFTGNEAKETLLLQIMVIAEVWKNELTDTLTPKAPLRL